LSRVEPVERSENPYKHWSMIFNYRPLGPVG
jgi:hypothetical protein